MIAKSQSESLLLEVDTDITIVPPFMAAHQEPRPYRHITARVVKLARWSGTLERAQPVYLQDIV